MIRSHLLTPVRRLILLASLLALLLLPAAQARSSAVMTIELDGFIDPNAARYVARAITEAADADAALLVIQLNTPGGLSASARQIVSSILEAPLPVAVFVTPRGAQAASAGMFVLAAAGVAAMSPGTNVGAASPIDATGQDVPETLASKVLQDTQAFARSIADARGRDPAALEAAITEARSYSATEALNLGLADVLADDLPDLLRQINGAFVPTAAGEIPLQLTDASIQPVDRTLLEHFLSVVATPNLAFILLTVGGIALLIELSNPGLVIPGVTGAIAPRPRLRRPRPAPRQLARRRPAADRPRPALPRVPGTGRRRSTARVLGSPSSSPQSSSPAARSVPSNWTSPAPRPSPSASGFWSPWEQSLQPSPQRSSSWPKPASPLPTAAHSTAGPWSATAPTSPAAWPPKAKSRCSASTGTPASQPMTTLTPPSRRVTLWM